MSKRRVKLILRSRLGMMKERDKITRDTDREFRTSFDREDGATWPA